VAIDIQSAEMVYPNGTRALQPIHLGVAPGEFVALLGPSGCGKSTLLKMIAGLLSPSGGRIELSGIEPPLSFVFQDATLMPWASVEANVRLPLDLAGVARAEAAARVAQALDWVGLSAFAHRRPRELSGGMQMRASIARGLVTRPQCLLMDEPFAALDDITRHRLDADLLSLWQRQHLTVVFVTHSITEAVFLASRVVVMGSHPGRVVDDVTLPQPWPRGEDYRTSPEFNAHVRYLQGRLATFSGHSAADEVMP
jgi:NitT/TauT family transport system ATP-binding protein